MRGAVIACICRIAIAFMPRHKRNFGFPHFRVSFQRMLFSIRNDFIMGAEVKHAVTDGESLEDVLKLISRYNLKRALKPIEEGGKLKLEVNETEIVARKEHYGFYPLYRPSGIVC